MRTQSHRDPLTIYEVMEILGEGSMGSVSRVRKRQDAVGGSARKAFVEKHSQHKGTAKCCFAWMSWLKLPTQADAFEADSSRTASTLSGSATTTVSATTTTAAAKRSLYRSQSSIVKYSESHKESFFALKSIHLDRCSTKEYVDELKVRTCVRRKKIDR